jgi:hypothetical protein
LGWCDRGCCSEGFVVLIFQLLIFPYISNFLGPIMATRIPIVRDKATSIYLMTSNLAIAFRA